MKRQLEIDEDKMDEFEMRGDGWIGWIGWRRDG
jgi:hypothetical protein